MDDRTDWLPKPAVPPRRPIAVRAVLGIVRLASLILGVVGVAMAGAAIFFAFQISGSARQQSLATQVALWYGYRAAAVIAVAIILRWVLKFDGRASSEK
jgi:hypothetical protein